jgi:hypothetical protein
MPPAPDQHEYPLGTLIAYGPDATRATKLVASVIPAPDAEAGPLERWFARGGDIRRDRRVSAEVADFFKEHGARETITAPHIFGCPHEEGIDYPLGAVCPECPFRGETDRVTLGPKSPTGDPPPSGHIPAEEILDALSEVRGWPPRAALASADVRRDELIEPLLTTLDRALDDPAGACEEDAQLSSHALYLLAKWREPRAFAPILRWLSLPDEGAFDLAGDIPAQAGARILASVCGGDRPEIRALIEDRAANEYCRGQALEALAVLVAWGELPHERLIEYLRELIEVKLERAPNFIWCEVAALVADLGAVELASLLRQPYDEQWIDPHFMSWEEIAHPAAGEESPFERFRRTHPPITDIAEETEWWGQYHHDVAEPAAPKIGRNEQCPCGSGKKYKHCCGEPA